MRTRTGTRRRGVLLALVVLLLGSVMAFPAAAGADEAFPPTVAAAPAEYQIGTFNMAGGNDEHGVKGVEAPEALVRSVQERRPAFVALQETCQGWIDTLRGRLGGANGQEGEYAVFFDSVLRGDLSVATCEDPANGAFGNGLILRKDVFGAATDLKPEAHSLTQTVIDDPRTEAEGKSAAYGGKERREMLCVRSDARRMVACSVHLTHDDRELRIAEASRAREILRDVYPGYTKLLGGDFNDDPLSAVADHFYAPGYQRDAEGEFKEVGSPCGNDIKEFGFARGPAGWPVWTYCRSGEATHNSGMKMDALYVPPWVDVKWADATKALHSDHVPLWAGVVL
ncbi:endonuclease/exonuclease/phosphatase family protein [Streptomyces sp. NPDC059002]|uniref:endonuclease/exonuclease/phosphatase family protein n=1 Tax=Streptomyces sp. NPDC059002 TaxID=3346690 RepID=UPI0036A52243